MTKSAASETVVGVPYKLSFVPGTGGRTVQYRPGRGEAGWTVVHVPASEVCEYLRRLPREAWMPGTERLARELGV